MKIPEDLLDEIIDYSDRFDDLFVKVYPLVKELDIELISIEDYDNCEDSIYEIPRFMSVAKYGYIKEYIIHKISGGIVYGLGFGEESGEELNMEVENLSYSEIINLINYIKD